MIRVAGMALALAMISCGDSESVPECDLPICIDFCDTTREWCLFEENPACPRFLGCEPLGQCDQEPRERCACVPTTFQQACFDFGDGRGVEVYIDPPSAPPIRWEPSPSPVF